MYNNNIIITIINKYYPTHHSAYNHIITFMLSFIHNRDFTNLTWSPHKKDLKKPSPTPLPWNYLLSDPPSPRNFCCPPGGEDYGFFLVLHNIILLNYCHLPSSDGSTCFDNLDLIHGGRILLPTAINPPGKSIKQSIGPFAAYGHMIFFKQI